MDKGIKLAVVLSIIIAILGIVFGGIAYGYSGRTVVVYGAIGAFFGAVGAPEIEPKYFKYPVTWQMFFSVAGCLLFAFGIEAHLEGYLIAILIGSFLGFTARFWVKHVNFP